MRFDRLTYVSGTCAASIFMVDTEMVRERMVSYKSGLHGLSTFRTMEVMMDFGPGCKNCETVKLRQSGC
jgi:hypothetical protein